MLFVALTKEINEIKLRSFAQLKKAKMPLSEAPLPSNSFYFAFIIVRVIFNVNIEHRFAII